MKKKLTIALVLALTGGTLWLAMDTSDRNVLKKGMPPGYYLECDNAGHYRPCRDGSPLIWFRGHGSKPEAIRRAWRQYEFDAEKYSSNWKRCE